MKRILAILLSAVLALSCAVVFAGCSGGDSAEYPVTIGDITIDKEPENIVVLNDTLADIVSYIGYDVKMVGRSIDCDQSYLSVVPSVGTSDNPAIDTIVNYETDLVIADSNLTPKAKDKLIEQGVVVITMEKANTFDELKVLYSDLGAALGGNVTGRAKGEEAYADLIETLNSFRSTVTEGVVTTAAYLYLDTNGELCTFINGTLEARIFSYNGALNVFANQELVQVDHEQLKLGAPTYIFYDDEDVLEYLRYDEELCYLAALNEGRTCQLPLKQFYRQGRGYEDAVYQMIDLMFVKSAEATPDEAEGYDAYAAAEEAEGNGRDAADGAGEDTADGNTGETNAQDENTLE